VLVRPLQSGNIGSAARALKNMGLRQLTLVEPRDWDFEKARIMAPGAVDVLEQATFFPGLAEALADCHFVVATSARGRKLRWPILTPRQLGERILDTHGRVAILFGPENSGLSNDDLIHCHALVTIQTDLAPSINLAQAVLIVAYELLQAAVARGYEPSSRMRRSRRGHRVHTAEPKAWRSRLQDEPATAERLMLVAEKGVELLSHSSYLLGRSPEQVRSTLYQLLQRAAPSDPESEVLLGMIAKLRHAVVHGTKEP
jgi:TrmH family RNA methyltransferase